MGGLKNQGIICKYSLEPKIRYKTGPGLAHDLIRPYFLIRNGPFSTASNHKMSLSTKPTILFYLSLSLSGGRNLENL
jgi:hypothetical protein